MGGMLGREMMSFGLLQNQVAYEDPELNNSITMTVGN